VDFANKQVIGAATMLDRSASTRCCEPPIRAE
jgi:hypothetical protein